MSSDFNRITEKQKFVDSAQFTIKEQKAKKSGHSEAVILKTTEKMNPIWRGVKSIGLFVLSALSLLGPILTKSVRAELSEHWGSVKEGAHRKYVKIDSSIGKPEHVKSFLEQGGVISLQSIKNVCAYTAVQKKISAGEDNISVDAAFAKKFNECPTHQLFRRNVGDQELYFLMKKFDDIDHVDAQGKGFNSDEERGKIKENQQRRINLLFALQVVEGALPENSMNENVPKISGITVEKVEIAELNEVVDPNVVAVAQMRLTCSNGDHDVELDAAVAMRKGSEKLSTPKAVGEDAFILDQTSIEVNGKRYQIPLAVTMDGGGGHTLAQYGRDHLKAAFTKHLTALVEQHGCIDSQIIAAAMQQADDELFAQTDASGNFIYSGAGYAKVDANHEAVLAEFGVEAAALKTTIQQLKTAQGEPLKMNPMEMYQAYQTGRQDFTTEIAIKQKTFDLTKLEDAQELQRYYALAMGTKNRIKVNLVMNAFFLEPEKGVENGGVQCVTYNRGDAMALCSQGEQTKALSKREETDLRTNRSCVTLQPGARVISACDGVTDVTSITDLGDANQRKVLKDKDSQTYVETLMKASIMTGSGDDKTVLSVRVSKHSL